jgi:hypothetical protein
MGVKEFSEFKAELKLELGQREDIESIGGVDYRGTWINSAYMTLATQNKMWGIRKNWSFPELEVYETNPTVDGLATIDTPSDCIVVRHVWDSTNDLKLTGISFEDYITYTGRATAASEGKPTEWVRNGDYIYLSPTPDAEYTLYVYYRKRPAKLVDDDDTTLIGPEWDEPILRLAKSLALRKLQQYDEAKKEQDYFEDMIRGVVGIYDQESLDRKDYRKTDPSYDDFGYK